MSYKALYREWRPKTFDEIVGQDHIVRTLENAIKNDRIAHAYLFCGIRGTGKTSTAKIFAKALNCEKGPTIKPCNKGTVCKGIDTGRVIDVVEIDGASNRGIEEIRDLRERIKFTPTEGKYKIYIIDEVHMLTKEAFNALLKTLEEPPKHAIFIFATTEPHKLPATILSRCQRFDFRRLTAEDIISQMEHILESDDIKAEGRALEIIARNAQGAMRDALSVLDQCISYGDGYITVEVVTDVLGTVNDEILFGFAETIIRKDTVKGMEIIEDVVSKGKDVHQFIKDLIYHFRNLMVCKASDNLEGVVELPDEIIKDLKLQTQKTPLENIIRILNILAAAESETRWSTFPRIVLEMTLIKLTHPQLDDSLEGILERLRNIEESLKTNKWVPTEVPTEVLDDKKQVEKNDIKTYIEADTDITQQKAAQKEAERNKIEKKPEKVAADKTSEKAKASEKNKQISLADVKTLWENTILKIKKEKLPLYCTLLETEAEPKEITPGGVINFEIKGYEGHKIYIENEIEYIESVLNEGRKESFKIKILTKEESTKKQAAAQKKQDDINQKHSEEDSRLFIEQVKEIFQGYEELIEIIEEE